MIVFYPFEFISSTSTAGQVFLLMYCFYVACTVAFYPKLGRTCMESILSGLLVKSYARVCRKKSKSPNHWIFSKEIFRPYLSIAAVNYAKVILQI